MLGFLIEGGVGAFFVLFFSLVAVAGSALFARNPDERKLPALRALLNVVWISSLLSSLTGLRATLAYVVKEGGDLKLLLAGGAELLAPLILGLAALSVAWMAIAIGQRRLQAQ